MEIIKLLESASNEELDDFRRVMEENTISGTVKRTVNKTAKKVKFLNPLGSKLDYIKEHTTGERGILSIRRDIYMCLPNLSTFGMKKDDTRYYKLVRKEAGKLKLEGSKYKDIKVLEKEICQEIIKKTLDQMSPEEKEALNAELKKKFEKKGVTYSGLGTLTAVGVANMSGFAVYTLATTTLGIVTSSLGITAPFAVYAGLTKAISIITGPIGVTITGIFTLLSLDRYDYGKAMSYIALILYLRSKYE